MHRDVSLSLFQSTPQRRRKEEKLNTARYSSQDGSVFHPHPKPTVSHEENYALAKLTYLTTGSRGKTRLAKWYAPYSVRPKQQNTYCTPISNAADRTKKK